MTRNQINNFLSGAFLSPLSLFLKPLYLFFELQVFKSKASVFQSELEAANLWKKFLRVY